MPHHQTAGPANPVSQSKISQLINQLSAVNFLKPDFNDENIRQLGLEIISKTQGAIALGAMRNWSIPSFPQGRSSIVDQFGLNKKNHCFRVQPIKWTRLHEPQVTGGFAHFLNEDNKRGHRERISAFLQVFGIKSFQKEKTCQIESEFRINTKERIDLLISWCNFQNLDETLIIEAKFQHELKSDQLNKYEKYALQELDVCQNRLHLFVLSPGSDEKHKNIVAQNRHWTELTWFKFLISYEKLLPEWADSEEFRQFRRTVWHRASN